jgi:hypothetical protein
MGKKRGIGIAFLILLLFFSMKLHGCWLFAIHIASGAWERGIIRKTGEYFDLRVL